MKSFAFITAFLILAYGAIAAIDEALLGDLTRQVLAEQRSKQLRPDPSTKFTSNAVVTWTTGSVTLAYDHPRVTLHQALETMSLKTIKFTSERAEHVNPPALDPEALVMALSPGLVVVLYHKDMRPRQVAEIVQDTVTMMSNSGYFQAKDYHHFSVYHNGKLQF